MTNSRDNGKRLETALWVAQIGFWDMDVPNDRIRWWNDWCATMHVDPCEGPEHTRRWDLRVHPEDMSNTDGFDALVAGESDYYQAEYRLLTLRGDWHWIMSRGRAVQVDEHGMAVRIVGVTVDIDQRKRTELALRETEARLELALSGGDLGPWDWDSSRDRVEWLNDWCRKIGIAPDHGPKTVAEWNENIHPEDRPRLEAVNATCLAGERLSYEFEYRYRDLKGAYRWLGERGRVIEQSPDGRATRISGICMDISARKLQERSIAKFQERFLAVVQKVPGFVFETMPTPDGFATMLWASDGIQNVFGCDLAEYQRRGWQSFWRAEDHAGVAENLQLLQSGRATQREWRVRDTIFYTPFTNPQNGSVETILAVALDITERVQLERQIAEAANLEQQRIARDLHDGLGQELTGISLSLSGISAHLRSSAPREAAELNLIIGLVDNAIVSTRGLAHGLAPLSSAPGALQHALRVLARSSKISHQIDIKVAAESAQFVLPIEHATHLYRIAQEALANAIRHAQASRIEIRLAFTSQRGILSISDNGSGLADMPERRFGMGIRTMAHRARMVDGEFSIGPRRRGGTRIVCKFPRPSSDPEP
jgi:signal transduction histidine kinase